MKPIDINADCQFLKDLQNNQQIAMWNLITTKGAVKLYTKGIKPNRHWKITDVKKYFGMNGNAEVLHSKLATLHEALTERNIVRSHIQL